ncbi:hypothetical protein [Nonomuraea sp. KM90]|uniref:hypothetical protein n=1 Tax=Nonomuraea sp. KM90 TaxID=3457428 RepID=UPI003FCD3370
MTRDIYSHRHTSLDLQIFSGPTQANPSRKGGETEGRPRVPDWPSDQSIRTEGQSGNVARPGEAVNLLEGCIDGLRPNQRRDKASYMARLAHAHAAAGAPDTAAETASDALVIATEVGSQSVRSELARLNTTLLSRWPDQPQALAFNDLITAA